MIFGLRFKNILFILFGAAIFSFGIVHFNMQNNLSEGGFTGITFAAFFSFPMGSILCQFNFEHPAFFYWLEAPWQKCFSLYDYRNSQLFLFFFGFFNVTKSICH